MRFSRFTRYSATIILLLCIIAWKLPGAEEHPLDLHDAMSSVQENDIANSRDPSRTRKASVDKWPGLPQFPGGEIPDLLDMENIVWPHFPQSPANDDYEFDPYNPHIANWQDPGTDPYTAWFICSNQYCPDQSECETYFWWPTNDVDAIIYDVQCNNGAECWLYPDAKIKVYVPAVEDLSVVRVSYKKTIPNYSGPPATCSKDVLIRCPEPCECYPPYTEPDEVADYAPYIIFTESGSGYNLAVDNTNDSTPSCGPWEWSISGSGWKLSHSKTYLPLEFTRVYRVSGTANVTVTATDQCGLSSSITLCTNCIADCTGYGTLLRQKGALDGWDQQTVYSGGKKYICDYHSWGDGNHSGTASEEHVALCSDYGTNNCVGGAKCCVEGVGEYGCLEATPDIYGEDTVVGVDQDQQLSVQGNGSCPPYTWTLDDWYSTGFSLSQTTTYGDGQELTLYARNACGTCKLTVTDKCGRTDTVYIRTTACGGSWTTIETCGVGAGDVQGYSGAFYYDNNIVLGVNPPCSNISGHPCMDHAELSSREEGSSKKVYAKP